MGGLLGAFGVGLVVGFGFYYRYRKPQVGTAISGRTEEIERGKVGEKGDGNERPGARLNFISTSDEQPVGGILRQDTNYGRAGGRVTQEIKEISNNCVNDNKATSPI